MKKKNLLCVWHWVNATDDLCCSMINLDEAIRSPHHFKSQELLNVSVKELTLKCVKFLQRDANVWSDLLSLLSESFILNKILPLLGNFLRNMLTAKASPLRRELMFGACIHISILIGHLGQRGPPLWFICNKAVWTKDKPNYLQVHIWPTPVYQERVKVRPAGL